MQATDALLERLHGSSQVLNVRRLGALLQAGFEIAERGAERSEVEQEACAKPQLCGVLRCKGQQQIDDGQRLRGFRLLNPPVLQVVQHAPADGLRRDGGKVPLLEGASGFRDERVAVVE